MTNFRLVIAAVSIPTITAIFGLLWLWERKKRKQPKDSNSSLTETEKILNCDYLSDDSFSGDSKNIDDVNEDDAIPLSNIYTDSTNNIANLSTEDCLLVSKVIGDDTKDITIVNDQKDVLTSHLDNGMRTTGIPLSCLVSNGNTLESVPSTQNSIKSKTDVPSLVDTNADGDVTSLVDTNADGGVTSLVDTNADGGVTSLVDTNVDGGVTSLVDTNADSGFTSLVDTNADGGVTSLVDTNADGGVTSLIDTNADDGVTSLVDTNADSDVTSLVDTNADGCVTALVDTNTDGSVQPDPEPAPLSLCVDDDRANSVATDADSDAVTTDSEVHEDDINSSFSSANHMTNALSNSNLLFSYKKDLYDVNVKEAISDNQEETEAMPEEMEKEIDVGGEIEIKVEEEVADSSILSDLYETGDLSEMLSDLDMSEFNHSKSKLDIKDQSGSDDLGNEIDHDTCLKSKPTDVISAIFSGDQLNDSELNEELANLQVHATKMSTPNQASANRVLSHAKELFSETRSITPPETDSDTCLSNNSKEMLSETLESDHTDYKDLLVSENNQLDDDDGGGEEDFSLLPPSGIQRRDDGHSSSSKNSSSENFHPVEVGEDNFPCRGVQHLVKNFAESDVSSDVSQFNSSDSTENQTNIEYQTASEGDQEEVSGILDSSSCTTVMSPLCPPETGENISSDAKECIQLEIEASLETKPKTLPKDFDSNVVVVVQEVKTDSNRTADCDLLQDTITVSQSELLSTDVSAMHSNVDSQANTISYTMNNNALSEADEPDSVTKKDIYLDHISTSNADSVASSNCDVSDMISNEDESCKISLKNPSSTLYEFYFPSELCGRLIGRQGKNIIHIKERSGASLSLQPNPFTPNHQICSIEGLREEIDEALKCITQKFPPSVYPNVDLTPIRETTQLASSPVVVPDLIQLSLPLEGVSVDVLVVSIVDAGHLFLQLPTHPTYAALDRLNQFMNRCYSQPGMVPQLPRPLAVGVICAAPVMDGWYRAVIVAVYDDSDDCEIKFVDYGGFNRVSGKILRQIRSDFMTLPFQAVEAYLANITPLSNEAYFSETAVEILQELTETGMLQAQVVSRAEDGTPYVHIYQINGNKVTFVNRELVNRSVVHWIEIL